MEDVGRGLKPFSPPGGTVSGDPTRIGMPCPCREPPSDPPSLARPRSPLEPALMLILAVPFFGAVLVSMAALAIALDREAA
jgi:hypothetical protein